ncbi:hypothetical protein P3T25_009365 [Paraburkholderia sp. GAS32]
MQARLDHAPEMMRIRRQTVEHPFGTIKAWMGATHFLTRTIERVSTEMSLHVLAYNMKRVIKLLGSEALMKAMRAWRPYRVAEPLRYVRLEFDVCAPALHRPRPAQA